MKHSTVNPKTLNRWRGKLRAMAARHGHDRALDHAARRLSELSYRLALYKRKAVAA